MDHGPFVFNQDAYLVGLRAKESAEEEAALLAAVNRFALRPLTRDEFAVFTLELCHNQIDRHHSRFADAELEVIDRLVPGRPLMERHDLRGSLPRGTFFRSQLVREGDRLTVQPEVYVLRTAENESFIRNIEGGVYRDISIGFSFRMPECSVCGKDIRSCAHVPGKSYENEACHFIMRGVLDVLEGSVVSSGSQGTQFVAPGTRQQAIALGEKPFQYKHGWWAAE